MKTDHLLDGVLGPAPDDPRFTASLAATLKAARGRRYRRQTARGAAVLAVLILAGWAGWRGTSPRPTTERLAGMAAPAAMPERQPGFVRIQPSPFQRNRARPWNGSPTINCLPWRRDVWP